MSNSLTAAINPISKAMKAAQEGSESRSDLNDDLKEVVKQAIYEVQEEQRQASQSDSGRSEGGSRSGSSGSSSSGGDSSGSDSSGSGALRKLMLFAGVAVLGYVAYRRRQSQQSTTHLEHAGDTKHASASDLPEAETVPPEGEPPQTDDSAGSDD